MPKYKKPAEFPTPFVPGASEFGLKDPFGATLQQPGGGRPQMDGGGGGGGGLPEGVMGDMLYHDGTDWVVLVNPGTPGTDPNWVLRHNGTNPFWAKPIRCA